MNGVRWLGALAVGAYLCAAPFLWYGFAGAHAHGFGHMDHGARHGGVLLMVRDFHVEVVEKPGHVELYLSDAERRPIAGGSGHVLQDNGAQSPLRWERHRLVAARPPDTHAAHYSISVPGGPPLEFKYP